MGVIYIYIVQIVEDSVTFSLRVAYERVVVYIRNRESVISSLQCL